MKPLKLFSKPFVNLWKFMTGERGDRIATMLKIAIDKSLPVVEAISIMTPTRIDDEIIALFKKYAVPNVDKWIALPVSKRGPALMEVASAQLERMFPSTPTHILRAAIDLALVEYRMKLDEQNLTH